MIRVFLFLLLTLLISHCSSPESSKPALPLTGLWEITNVKVGTETMTPIAKWIRLQADGTQEGGNGWLQHSIGTWTYNSSDSTLRVINTNGWKDENEAFKIKVEGNQMTWHRSEEGQALTVIAKRIEQLPAAPANQILGVWALDEMTSQDTAISFDPKAYLLIRWDNIFRFQVNAQERKMGTWTFNGHRPLLEMTHYDDPPTREQWTVEVSTDSLVLTRTERFGQTPLIQKYHRIDYFPQ